MGTDTVLDDLMRVLQPTPVSPARSRWAGVAVFLLGNMFTGVGFGVRLGMALAR